MRKATHWTQSSWREVKQKLIISPPPLSLKNRKLCPLRLTVYFNYSQVVSPHLPPFSLCLLPHKVTCESSFSLQKHEARELKPPAAGQETCSLHSKSINSDKYLLSESSHSVLISWATWKQNRIIQELHCNKSSKGNTVLSRAWRTLTRVNLRVILR